jgi:hypothetical protein
MGVAFVGGAARPETYLRAGRARSRRTLNVQGGEPAKEDTQPIEDLVIESAPHGGARRRSRLTGCTRVPRAAPVPAGVLVCDVAMGADKVALSQ